MGIFNWVRMPDFECPECGRNAGGEGSEAKWQTKHEGPALDLSVVLFEDLEVPRVDRRRDAAQSPSTHESEAPDENLPYAYGDCMACGTTLGVRSQRSLVVTTGSPYDGSVRTFYRDPRRDVRRREVFSGESDE